VCGTLFYRFFMWECGVQISYCIVKKGCRSQSRFKMKVFTPQKPVEGKKETLSLHNSKMLSVTHIKRDPLTPTRFKMKVSCVGIPSTGLCGGIERVSFDMCRSVYTRGLQTSDPYVHRDHNILPPVLQLTATDTALHLQHTCNTLQHTTTHLPKQSGLASHCQHSVNTLQYTAIYYNTLQHTCSNTAGSQPGGQKSSSSSSSSSSRSDISSSSSSSSSSLPSSSSSPSFAAFFFCRLIFFLKIFNSCSWNLFVSGTSCTNSASTCYTHAHTQIYMYT